jgi:hypothetical protein
MLSETTESLESNGRLARTWETGQIGRAVEDLGSVGDGVHMLEQVVLLAESLLADLARPAVGDCVEGEGID